MTESNGTFMSQADYDLLRRSKCKELSDDQFLEFRHAIERFKLDPFANQIYAVVRNVNVGERDKPAWEKRMMVQTGIDGFRLVADRTRQYAGNDDPTFNNEEKPTKATVTVYKIVDGQRCPFTASARWNQYYPGDRQGMMWKRMPHLMLGKCAEALALRKAFPAELAGLYTTEEMQQADREPAAGNGNGQKTDQAPDAPPPKPGKESAQRAAAWRDIEAAEKWPAMCDLLDRIKRSEFSDEVKAELRAKLTDKMLSAAVRQCKTEQSSHTLDKLTSLTNACFDDEQRAVALAAIQARRDALAAESQGIDSNRREEDGVAAAL